MSAEARAALTRALNRSDHRSVTIRRDHLRALLETAPPEAAPPQTAPSSEAPARAAAAAHREDLARLRALKQVLTERLAMLLDGRPPPGPCLGDRESISDLLEKLSRITGRLIPLERHVHALDAAPPPDEDAPSPVAVFALPDNGRA